MKKGPSITSSPPLKSNGLPAKKSSVRIVDHHVTPASSPTTSSLSLQAPESPRMPDVNDSTVSDIDKLQQIQTYIEEFEYNYSGKPFLKLNKAGGAKHLQTSALELIRMALPIQCVEALFIGCWLSKDMLAVDRLPLSFKSIFQGNVHRHIVMAIRYEGKWGTIGISRRSNLMDKPIVYNSLITLIREYEMSYVSVNLISLFCYHSVFSLFCFSCCYRLHHDLLGSMFPSVINCLHRVTITSRIHFG